MKVMNTAEMREVNGGAKRVYAMRVTVRCAACKKRITGNVWQQYAHCFKHGVKQGWALWSAITMFF